MAEPVKASVMAAFAADALSLGAHWVYDTGDIDRKIGRIISYHNPIAPFHSGKTAGQFTHYGDQMLVLLQSLKACGGYDPVHFADTWRSFFTSYGGYFDHATKDTLHNLDQGLGIKDCGSASEDLGGASRIPPLVFAHPDNLDKLVAAARSQTAFTHNDPRVVDSAKFFAGTVFHVLNGKPPSAAIRHALDGKLKGTAIARLIETGLGTKGLDTRKTIAGFGQMCAVEAALPATVHLIVSYEDDLKTALVENVMAGGDSAARGVLAGMVLGAWNGMDAIPTEWIDDMIAGKLISGLLDTLES